MSCGFGVTFELRRIKLANFKAVEGDNRHIIPIVTAVLVVLFTLVFLFLRLRRSSRRGVLITGICDSGKTLLFSRLAFDKYVDTYTSVKENLAHYPPGKTKLQLIDVPGHERVRNKFLDEYKTTSKALIYVIDSNTLQKEIRDVAEYLYNLLTDKVILNNCTRILILCNKQDVPMAKNSKVIRSLLERELNTLRETKASQLSSTDESSAENRVPLGKLGEEFNFSQIYPANIEFAECYSVDKEEAGPNLDQLKDWLGATSI